MIIIKKYCGGPLLESNSVYPVNDITAALKALRAAEIAVDDAEDETGILIRKMVIRAKACVTAAKEVVNSVPSGKYNAEQIARNFRI